jgi:FKBP-type peptidyl-prolyl cis-trans isomerase
MVNKFEALGIAVSVGAMALALFLLQVSDNNVALDVASESQVASVVVAEGEDKRAVLGEALTDAISNNGKLTKMIIDDVTEGVGAEVKAGDSITVNYIGTLQSGQQFDNSYTKGTPFTFTVGDGKVIKGWDEGVLGMKTGGQRILVIPSDLAYGENGYGPIPGGATLVFTIELISIN